MHREQKTEAVILRTTDVFDADRLYLLVTREFGKLRARARGVRRPTSKLTGHLLSFLPTELQLVEQNGWFLIVQAHGLSNRTYPEKTLSFLQAAEVLAEGVDALLVEREAHPELYDALVYVLERLRDDGDSLLMIGEFFWKCLSVMGYLPELAVSVVTQEPLRADELAWSSAHGGLMNRSEASPHESCIMLHDTKVAVALRQIVKPEFVAERLRMDDEVREVLVQVLFDYVQQHIQKPLMSLGMHLSS